jgi:exopolysaccharide production protein ExoF
MWRIPSVAVVWVAALLAASVPAVGAATTPDYILGAGDKVQLKVYDWRSTIGEVHEWTALSGDFTIGPAGNLSLPLLGDVRATGRTTSQLGKVVSEAMQAAVGLAKLPTASVQIITFRPFYIVGAVQRPGSYPFQPAMTMLQAISVAGGLFRPTDASDVHMQRVEHDRLLARAARLRAEVDGAANIDFPPGLLQRSGDPVISRLMKAEQVVFAARREAFRAQDDGLNQQRVLFQKEILSLKAKILNDDQELAMLKREVETVSSLVTRGLGVAPREFSLRQSQLEMEARRLDLDGAILRAQEEVARADTAIADLRNKLKTQTLADQQQTETDVQKISAALASQEGVLEEDRAAINSGPTYIIIRQDGDSLRSFEASETTSVMPGDTIKVKPTGGSRTEVDVDASAKPQTPVRPGY